MEFGISYSECQGNKENCIYPKRAKVSSADELKEVTRFDHLCGEFKDNRRSKSNFRKSDVVVMDCDNDHSDNPEDWITAEKLAEMLQDVRYALVPSRNHMREKNGKSARARFHVYFPIGEITNAEDYAALKKAIHERYSFFDGNALDAARFIFGADSGEVVWHDGCVNIDEIVECQSGKTVQPTGTISNVGKSNSQNVDSGDNGNSDIIRVGKRNNTLHKFALRVLTRYGMGIEAFQHFMKENNKCERPLGETELRTIWNSAVNRYMNVISKQPDYVPPNEYNGKSKGRSPGGKSLMPPDYSDIGEAKVLVREHGDKLKYSDATDYLLYDGKRWVEDRQAVIGALEKLLDLQLAEAKETVETAKKHLINMGISKQDVNSDKWTGKDLTDDQRPYYLVLREARRYLSFIMKHRDFKFVDSTLKAAKPMLLVDVNDLDKNAFLLNTPQATYDLTKGMAGAQTHDPNDLITKMTECAPGDKGIRLWVEALVLFFCGDLELIEYVQFIVGMAAVGMVYGEHLIIAYGGGANGKSTFWNTISRVLGNYSGRLSAEALTVGCKRNVKPEMAELKGKRLIIAAETEEGMRLNTSVVKQLCSTDEVFAEKKYKAPFSFAPSHTLVLYTNHLPRVGANDDGIWRRLIVIPFNAKITGESDIKNYADYLYENAGEAVMKWIIIGAQKAIAANFKVPIPKCVETAIQAYREGNDWLGHFVEECLEVGASFHEKSGELYQLYRAYCRLNGDYTRSTADFYSALDESGFTRRKTNKGMFVNGLKCKDKKYIADYLRAMG